MMYLPFRKSLISILLIISSTLFAQTDSVVIIENHQIAINGGIYSSVDELRNNKPSKIGEFTLLSPEQVTKFGQEGKIAGSFFTSGQFIWLGNFDDSGRFVRIDPSLIWAYVEDEVVYVQHDGYLNKLSVVGTICYFSNYDAKFIDTSKTKERAYLFNINNGKIKRFNRSNLLNILSNDIELYQKFLQEEAKKKMDDSLLDYVNQYNERNLFAFPE